ncbi:MAG: DNA polymerase III subunit delta [Legionellales bacterium]|nr:DNA polymerase III subunit delta [Legionellales bacterium]|tara:strand:+ start:2415 stop:3455 length:1041 start_codon:yes stop_codon:yes gene_type:complete
MPLKIDQLETHLKNSANKPIYIVSGDEPFQKQECIDQIRAHYRKQGYEERVVFDVTGNRNFDWNIINEANNNLSLFSNKKIIELRMKSPKPGKEGGSILQQYAERQNDDTLLIISSEKMDAGTKKTKWVKSIEKIGVLIEIWPIDYWQLPGWIQKRIIKKGKKISQDASKLIADKVEGNLLAANQEIEKLALLIDKDNIDIEDVVNAVVDSSRYNVFDMIESAFLGNSNRTLLMLNGLHNEGVEPLAIFGAFMWEYRRLCSIMYEYESGQQLEKLFREHWIWKDQKKRAMNAVLKRHSSKTLDELLNYSSKIDKTLKSGQKENAWQQFCILLLAIAGINTNKLQII